MIMQGIKKTNEDGGSNTTIHSSIYNPSHDSSVNIHNKTSDSDSDDDDDIKCFFWFISITLMLVSCTCFELDGFSFHFMSFQFNPFLSWCCCEG